MQKEKKFSQFMLTIAFVVICSIILIPFLFLVSASFSNEQDVLTYGFKLIPLHFDLAAYKYVFSKPQSIVNAYKVTITFSFVAMAISTLLISMAAYPLASPKMRGKAFFSFYFYFTMLFSGGLVPTYILITQYLHLNDKIWVYILPGLISPWYVFMTRSFFADIPASLSESMRLDGASEWKIFCRLMLPMSKPAIATVALMMFLTKWNDWTTSMLYINDQNLISLQYLLQKLLREIAYLNQNAENGVNFSAGTIPTTTVQMATAMVVAGPAMLVFPFFQKYFVKGLKVGAVKG